MANANRTRALGSVAIPQEDSSVTVELTSEQLAYIRAAALEQLAEGAETVATQAREAADDPEAITCLDARGTARLLVAPWIAILDVLGWDTRGDGEALRGARRAEATA